MRTPIALSATVCVALAECFSLPGANPVRADALKLPHLPGNHVLEAQVRRDLHGVDLRGKDGPLAKLGYELAVLFREYEAHDRGAGAAFQPSNAGLPVSDGFVVIDAASDEPGKLLAELEKLGLRHGARYRRMVSGRLPIESIGAAASLPSLRLARAAVHWSNVGAVTSQGDSAMEAGLFRAQQAVDGTGVTIGVLSDSYDCFETEAVGDVLTGDLPGAGNPFGRTTPVEILDDSACGTDEGRAMMQLIHDVAPGAAQSFHTAIQGQADFALGIEELAGCPPGSTPGCVPAATPADILVDDVSYLAAPFFQDGIVAQAVDFVVDSGVAYFSSAGNIGRNSYESPFVESGITLDIGAGPQRAHDFDPGPGVDVFQRVTLPRFALVQLVLQWDQPFFSVSGGSGSLSDFDLVVMDDPPTTVLASSADRNVGGDPVELRQYAHALSTTTFNVAILEYDPDGNQPDPGLLKYVVYGNLSIDEFATRSGTTYGHANAAGAEAVGAAFYGDTPPYGTVPPVIESFSSAGGVPILLGPDGMPLGAPVVREKPGIVAPDGTNTTFFGTDIEEDADTHPNFFGTSAAAPHAAALGALLLQIDPALSPQDLYQQMRTNAIDMDDPLTGGFDAGFDFGTGYGLVKALTPTTGVSPGPASDLASAWTYPNPFGPATTIRWTLPAAGEARVDVYDPRGRRVRTLVDGPSAAGTHETSWDGRDVEGKPLAGGVYFVRIESGDHVQVVRTVLLR